jgi:hypothetical protein
MREEELAKSLRDTLAWKTDGVEVTRRTLEDTLPRLFTLQTMAQRVHWFCAIHGFTFEMLPSGNALIRKKEE